MRARPELEGAFVAPAHPASRRCWRRSGPRSSGSTGRHPRQLLRAGRGFHPQHSDHRQSQSGGPSAHPQAAVSAPDDRRAGRGGRHHAGVQAEQGAGDGPVPLTPIQHWFFEQQLADPHHCNQAMLLEARQALDLLCWSGPCSTCSCTTMRCACGFMCAASGWQQVNAGS